jgi:hypothetical protein
MAEATEDVPIVAAVATTRDDAMHEERGERVTVCAEHAVALRTKSMAPYMLRVITHQAAAAAAAERLDTAVTGAAEAKDLALVDRWLDDFHQLARLAEKGDNPTWQSMAAQLEELSTRLQPVIDRHLN